jgi:hypothetical protein
MEPKEYKEGALVRAGRNTLTLLNFFEEHFQKITSANGLPHPHLRQPSLSKFKPRLAPLRLNCPKGHNHDDTVLTAYCNIRIFRWVRCKNQELKKGKKG